MVFISTGRGNLDLAVGGGRSTRHVARVYLSIFLAPLAAVILGTSAEMALSGTDAASQERLARQFQEYNATVKKTILELQPYRTTTTGLTKGGGLVTLSALNPNVNDWLLLTVGDKAGGPAKFYHLENPYPRTQKISLVSQPALHVAIQGKQSTYRCVPWKSGVSPLARARASALPFAPICGGRLYLRNKINGSRTNLEATAEFLRDNVWLGENIVGFVKSTFFRDKFLETAKEVSGNSDGIEPLGLVKATLGKSPVVATYMELKLKGAPKGRMRMGSWYPVIDLPGVFAMTLQPGSISREILGDHATANRLDSVESHAQAYFLAFDLSQFNLGYEVGTTHPRLQWSSRPSGKGRDYSLPGPDGIDDAAPVINLGMISPALTKHIVATFTGGFKRDHGAFRYGPYATTNHGHHYGFIVHGVIESKLQPDLATLYVLNDGTINMKTWTAADNKLLPKIRFARQNGVPLVERDTESGKTMPGPLVPYWGPGNWSGSAKVELRTLRAGACLRHAQGKNYLIYGYFSTATPSAMARSFQALSCDYAMLLDMNALEHTYSAVYVRKQGGLQAQHLVRGMAAIDKKKRDGSPAPRFIGFSDNRDFFYLTRKDAVN